MCTICQALDPNSNKFDMHGVSSFDSGDISVSNNKPVYTYDQIADYLTEGFWSDFNTTARHYDVQTGDTITYNLDGLTSTGTAAAEKAFEAWTAVSGLQFAEVSKAQAQMVFDDNQSGAFASSSVSGGHIIKSTINVHTSWAGNPDYYHQTYMHEIGHALGLGHTGDYNGSANYTSDAAFANDSWQTSVMSYFSQGENTYTDATSTYLATLQLGDIAAIHKLYGTPVNVETGDTVYGDGATSDRFGMDLPSSYAVALVDSGGVDLINLASRTHNQTINLNQETFSNINGRIGNMAIGRDTVIENVTTGSGNDYIIGNDAANRIDAGAGNDTILAGAGNDILIGGAGADELTGGTGADIFVYSTLADAGDTITDFSLSQQDRVDVSGLMAAIGYGGDDPVADGMVSLQAGSGGSWLVVNTGGSTTQLTFLEGISADADLTQIIGWGDPAPDPGPGPGPDPEPQPGDLDDIYVIDSTFVRNWTVSRSKIEDTNGGNDTLDISAISTAVSVTLEAGVRGRVAGKNLFLEDGTVIENLILGRGNDRGTGNSAANLMQGNGGNDRLYGKGGDDLVDGGEGNDRLYGEEGDDTVLGGAGADMIYGGNGNDALDGGDGNDRIYGGDGNNLIDGGAGNDRIYGGDGDDTIDGGAGGDFIRAEGGDNRITATSGDNRVYAKDGDDRVTTGAGRDMIDTGAGDDVIDAGDGNNRIVSASGNNTVIAGRGHDNIRLGAGDDVVRAGDGDNRIYASSGDNQITTGSGKDMIYASGGDDLVNAGDGDNRITITGGNNGVVTGAGRDNIRLGDGADTVLAGDGLNRIDTAGGNDLIGSGSGNDRINAGAGDDVIDAGEGMNTVDGGTGNDRITTGSGSDRIKGGAGDDTINAGAGTNRIDAGEGNNSVTALGGNDAVTSGNGVDIVDVGDGANRVSTKGGNDQITTGSGADRIDAGAGDDVISAGAGNDTIVGGTGADDIDAGAGDDRITAGDGADIVRAGAGNDRIYGNDGNDLLYGGGDNDDIRGGDDDDRLYGDAGDDDLSGEKGNDSLFGGAGIDELDGGLGDDVLNGGAGEDELTGGSGADLFIFDALATIGDTIRDFKQSEGDRLDIAGLLTELGLDLGDALASGDLALRDVGSSSYLTVNHDADSGTDALDIAYLMRVDGALPLTEDWFA